jgi:putative nucleotidyltransferase with HDIG domain
LKAENVVAYFAVPLIIKGQVMGVLEICHRSPLDPNEEWLDFLRTLAGQAAIAIDTVHMFENLQRSTDELELAYDATIEGWSHALDLRDKETEGHTKRVTEMTVKLARTFGLNEGELMKVRWGALLHDIGKMGVPDAILLKPGALTKEEWVVMKRHPMLAYEMLSPIRYLHEALDIPYCHHEWWDGKGYPLGLKGEQIPLVARIFAVVDVWDALISDRPYRKAWSKEKVFEHIQSEAGTHFDPQVVKTFFAEYG